MLRLTAAANQFIKQTMGAEMSHNPTVREWLEIHKDLDAYIARGGKLMDLWLADAHFLDEEPLTAITAKTRLRSAGELEITLRISAVTACCSRASPSSRVSPVAALPAWLRLRWVSFASRLRLAVGRRLTSPSLGTTSI